MLHPLTTANPSSSPSCLFSEVSPASESQFNIESSNRVSETVSLSENNFLGVLAEPATVRFRRPVYWHLYAGVWPGVVKEMLL